MSTINTNMKENTPIFEGRNLTIHNKSNRLIFEKFSFSINAHEIWMVQGPNGIGKTSLYESLMGIGPVESGNLLLQGEDITKMKPEERVRHGMRYIPQNNALFDDVSVLDNLTILAQSLLSPRHQKQAIERAIKLFELESFVKKTPSQLSGGMKRRVELSKIVIGPAKLILIDEPFAAIDGERIEFLGQIFKTLAKEGISFFINDHHLESLYQIANFCIHIENPPRIEQFSNA